MKILVDCDVLDSFILYSIHPELTLRNLCRLIQESLEVRYHIKDNINNPSIQNINDGNLTITSITKAATTTTSSNDEEDVQRKNVTETFIINNSISNNNNNNTEKDNIINTENNIRREFLNNKFQEFSNIYIFGISYSSNDERTLNSLLKTTTSSTILRVKLPQNIIDQLTNIKMIKLPESSSSSSSLIETNMKNASFNSGTVNVKNIKKRKFPIRSSLTTSIINNFEHDNEIHNMNASITAAAMTVSEGNNKLTLTNVDEQQQDYPDMSMENLPAKIARHSDIENGEISHPLNNQSEETLKKSSSLDVEVNFENLLEQLESKNTTNDGDTKEYIVKKEDLQAIGRSDFLRGQLRSEKLQRIILDIDQAEDRVKALELAMERIPEFSLFISQILYVIGERDVQTLKQDRSIIEMFEKLAQIELNRKSR